MKIILLVLTLISITPNIYPRKANAQPMLPMAINTAKNLAGVAAIVGTGINARKRMNRTKNNAPKTSLSTTTTSTTKN